MREDEDEDEDAERDQREEEREENEEGIRQSMGCSFESLPVLVFVSHVLMPLLCAPLAWVLLPNTPFNMY